jgi:membrane-bound serine protease (ClpP class)
VIATFLSLISSFYLSRKLFTTTAFGQLALNTVQNASEGYTSADQRYRSMIGKSGVAHTVLRPSGKALIEDEIFDATADSGYIEKGEGIVVVKHETAQLFVRRQA